jgi:hypothetical protein
MTNGSAAAQFTSRAQKSHREKRDSEKVEFFILSSLPGGRRPEGGLYT